MHRLRIVFSRIGDNLVARNMARPEGPEVAGLKIFKCQGHNAKCRRGSLIVAVICSNLNPVACMAFPRSCPSMWSGRDI
jgi:hypothetical protein